MTKLPTTPHPPQFLADHPVGLITPHPRNARDWNREAIRTSLEDNSQYKPVVVQRSSGYIIAGNGTYTVATQDLGWDVIHTFVVDVDDTTALRILLADNKIPDGSGYLAGPLVDLLAELSELPDGLQGTGYDQEDLDALLADVESDAATALGEDPPPSPAASTTTREPRDDDREPRDHDDDREPAPRGAGPAAPMDDDATAVIVRLPFTPDDHEEYQRLAAQGREALGELPTAQVVLRALRALAVLTDWGPQLTDEQATALAAIGVPTARP